MCAMYNKSFRRNPSALRPRGCSKGTAALEGNSTLGEVFLRAQANTGNPRLRHRVEALEEAKGMLHLNQLLWSFALELLAKVIAANFSISRVEEEEDVLLLILNCVELAGTLGKSLITERDTLSQVADRAVVTCDFGHVVFTLIAANVFACHKALSGGNNDCLLEVN